eukprot:COSAG06_NODE_58526_length_276_cov_75.898305_1_plen_26_part_10
MPMLVKLASKSQPAQLYSPAAGSVAS